MAKIKEKPGTRDPLKKKREYVPQSVRPPKQITPQTVKDKRAEKFEVEGKASGKVTDTVADKNWEDVKDKARAAGKIARKGKQE